ncbi:MAG: hypothetical protein ACE1S7_02555 [Candidatus Tisiphia sp.]
MVAAGTPVEGAISNNRGILQVGLLIRIKKQISLKRSKFMTPMVRELSKIGVLSNQADQYHTKKILYL